ncbi:MAG: tyrosine--tRNA ligase, partial [Sphaerochaeta sp.]|nr:tyrosine--tRNA ligase [Sphaerochaeta sp.]
AQYEKEGVNINEAKQRLAYEQTKIIHGEEEAEKALAAAKAMFGSVSLGSESREGMPSLEIEKSVLDQGIPVLELFAKTDLASTNSDARRLVTGGGAWIGEVKIDDAKALIDSSYLDEFGELLLRAGKKRYFRIIVK